MASRSFKPPSYFASQPAKRSTRPPFTRSSSASSTKSEDSFVATLRGLSTSDTVPGKPRDSTGSLIPTGGASPRRCHTPVNDPSLPRQVFDDTPGRKKSQPIAIELPPRRTPVYTPLTARGDLPGGYFPLHENSSKPYKSIPFPKYRESYDSPNSTSQPSSPLNMSNDSSATPSPTETTRRAPPSIITPAFKPFLPASEALTMPMGKYHPSNYQAPAKIPTLAPSRPPTNISLPSAIPDRKNKKSKSGHERHASDVKRKLQEYQMGQAKNAAMLASFHGASKPVGFSSEPISPRLAPLGSPGPITPFELEDSPQAGYVVAGASRALVNEGIIVRGLDREGGRELVGRMIRAEEERRVIGGEEGSHSPVLRV